MHHSWPSASLPMVMMPAVSRGPQTTSFDRVGSFFSWTPELLYEQCSLHMTLKMPSSVRLGWRPRMETIRSYSSGVMECAAMTSGVIWLIFLFSLRGEGGDEGVEDAEPVGGGHEGIGSAFGMGHHAHDVAGFVEDAGD